MLPSYSKRARKKCADYTHKLDNHIVRLVASMKRKLNEDDAPTVDNTRSSGPSPSTFSALGLDTRLLQAVANENFTLPTTVQSTAIPLALEGKDILGM